MDARRGRAHQAIAYSSDHTYCMHNPNGAECAALYYSRLESAAFFQAAQTASERRAGADAHAPARCQVTQIDHMAAEPTHGPHHPCSSSSWLGARGPLLASGRSSTAEVFTEVAGVYCSLGCQAGTEFMAARGALYGRSPRQRAR